MRHRTELTPHEDDWVNLANPYIAALVDALSADGIEMPAAWMDPCFPRDATILVANPGQPLQGLVWDEETGLRTGQFVAGRQGIRTELADAAYLGGGLLPPPEDVVRRLKLGVREPRTLHRRHNDVRDGLDDHLRTLH